MPQEQINITSNAHITTTDQVDITSNAHITTNEQITITSNTHIVIIDRLAEIPKRIDPYLRQSHADPHTEDSGFRIF
jgi:acyl-CoA thioesterase FadM